MADESEEPAHNAALYQIDVPLNRNYREDLSFGRRLGRCLYHVAASIRRGQVRMDFDLSPSTTSGTPSTTSVSTSTTSVSTSATPVSTSTTSVSTSTTSLNQLMTPRQSRIIPAATSDGQNMHRRRGAPFDPHTDFQYIGRDLIGPGERGPRMYRVDVFDDRRIYVVDRTVQGSRPSQKIVLLRCEQFFSDDCQAFGYKYEGVIYLYGFHNHD